MKVKELIKRLEKRNQNEEVVVSCEMLEEVIDVQSCKKLDGADGGLTVLIIDDEELIH